MSRFVFFVCFGAIPVWAGDVPVTSRLISAGLFKNGLVVVTEEFSVEGSGTYLLSEVPKPIHGTLWIESDAQVITRTARRKVSEPLGIMGMGSIGEALVGRDVSLALKDGLAGINGSVLNSGKPGGAGRFLLLASGSERYFVDTAMIAFIKTNGLAAGEELKRTLEKQVLLFEVTSPHAAVIRFSYLARGISWAPSYRIELEDGGRLRLTQKTVVRNEWRDLKDTELQLISGYPNIQYGHVSSPLFTDWATFFRQIGQHVSGTGQISLLQNAVTQQSFIMSPSNENDLPDNPTAEGLDIYYHSAGSFSLDKGESLVFDTGTGTADYKRIVRWSIGNRRQPDGRVLSVYGQNADTEMGEIWDAVSFKNPLAFPMTTAPALFLDKGRIAGQSLSTWANPGSPISLRVTKALSIEAIDRERVAEGDRKTVDIFGWKYHREQVAGELRIHNSRAVAVNMVIEKHFCGKLMEADGNPTSSQLKEGLYYVNQLQALNWEMKLDPGERRKLTYRYEVLVRH